MTRVAVAAVAALLLLAAPARADNPTFSVSPSSLGITLHGQFASVSVACNGSGHVTWSAGNEVSPVAQCDLLQTITITGTEFADEVDLHQIIVSGQWGAMQSTTFNGGDGSDHITGSAFTDHIDLGPGGTNASNHQQALPGAGNDDVTGSGLEDLTLSAAGTATLSDTDYVNGAEHDTFSGIDVYTVTGSSGPDNIDTSANSRVVVLSGGGDADTLKGSAAFNGGAGDDTIEGGGVGNSMTVSALTGTGNGATADASHVTSADGTDTYSGVPNLTILGNSSDNSYDWTAFPGNATLVNDFGGNDVVRGGGGNDSIFMAGGVDDIDSGAGDDAISVPGTDADTIQGGPGTDTVTVAQASAGTTTAGPADAPLAATVTAIKGPDATQNANAIEAVALDGSFGDDVLDTRLFAGEATLNGSSGADILLGGPGTDTLKGSTGVDCLNGAAAADAIDGGAGADLIVPDAADTVTADAADGTVTTCGHGDGVPAPSGGGGETPSGGGGGTPSDGGGTPSSPSTPSTPPTPPTPLAPAFSLTKIAKTITLDKKGAFTFKFAGRPGLSGTATFTGPKKLKLGKVKFKIDAKGRATVKVKLSKSVFKKAKKLKKAKTAVALAAGADKATAKFTLKAPKR